ncbi:MAG: CcdB family protein, partial [Pseudomonadota bacterium]
MARFDVYQYDSAFAPLVVDVQADLLNDLSTRVIIPLIPFDKIK